MKITRDVLKFDFGKAAQIIGQCLSSLGPSTIQEIISDTKLPETKVKQTLIVLIKHSIIIPRIFVHDYASTNTSSHHPQYVLQDDVILARLHHTKYISLSRKLFQHHGSMIAKLFCFHGSVSIPQLKVCVCMCFFFFFFCHSRSLTL